MGKAGADHPRRTHVRDLVGDELERPRRRQLTLCALIVLALLIAGVVVVSLLPAPPALRQETNPVPVPWFAEGQLHLAEVVVTQRLGVSVAPTGESVHLMEIAASGPEAGVYVRFSETISRLFVVCRNVRCTTLRRIVVRGRDVRLR